MKKEDIEFLKSLQNEMRTQDTFCQANPRFWVVKQTVKDYWVEDDIEGICIFDTDRCETVFDGDIEALADWIKEELKDIIVKCEYNYGYLDIICNDEEEYYIESLTEIKDFIDTYCNNEYSICYYRLREEICEDTMFLTIRECREHIEDNKHHYNNTVHPYAMTAWRSPQVSRLYEILENTDWEKELNE